MSCVQRRRRRTTTGGHVIAFPPPSTADRTNGRRRRTGHPQKPDTHARSPRPPSPTTIIILYYARRRLFAVSRTCIVCTIIYVYVQYNNIYDERQRYNNKIIQNAPFITRTHALTPRPTASCLGAGEARPGKALSLPITGSPLCSFPDAIIIYYHYSLSYYCFWLPFRRARPQRVMVTLARSADWYGLPRRRKNQAPRLGYCFVVLFRLSRQRDVVFYLILSSNTMGCCNCAKNDFKPNLQNKGTLGRQYCGFTDCDINFKLLNFKLKFWPLKCSKNKNVLITKCFQRNRRLNVVIVSE